MSTRTSQSATTRTSAAGVPPAPANRVNIACVLDDNARKHPDEPAVIVFERKRAGRREYRRISFRDLSELSTRYAAGLAAAGVRREMRTVLMVRPGIEFFALTFALFKLGAVPVLIDPGIGRRSIVKCLAEIRPQAFIGIPLAHVLRVLHRRAFSGLQVIVTLGRRWGWGGHSLAQIARRAPGDFAPADTRASDTAAILFTSGSTGPSKGVVYTHGIFDAQVRYLRTAYGYAPDEIDLATFPLFALFDAALGMTCVIPEMDATRPGSVDPTSIIDAVGEFGCTHMFGSPALLDRVSRYAVAHGVTLPTLKRVMTAGAPVSPRILERTARMLAPEARIFTPYGATEALPVASIDHREVLDEALPITARGGGVCIGRPLDGLRVRVIEITDQPIADWSQARRCAVGQVGEITVEGPIVTPAYCEKPRHTALAKINRDGAIVHRMGDVGYFDEHGRLWFAGRKSQRVRTARGPMFTEMCEQVFNQHPAVRRTALVGVGPADSQTPVLCVELEPPADRPAPAASLTWPNIRDELSAWAQRYDLTRSIRHFLPHRGFPVDVRHNAKIFREKLAVWAERQVSAS
ncbi:MAG: peptide synthase [Planctomycetota bacterium]|nr:MAG: peptide synthase [Planctomycetota bacterium]